MFDCTSYEYNLAIVIHKGSYASTMLYMCSFGQKKYDISHVMMSNAFWDLNVVVKVSDKRNMMSMCVFLDCVTFSKMFADIRSDPIFSP